MTRAKFKVEYVTYSKETAKIVLNPVINGSEENAKFYKYTPGGLIELQIVSHETAALFIPGKEYYIDFTLASN